MKPFRERGITSLIDDPAAVSVSAQNMNTK
jgi:hypothetical protein